MHNAVAKLAGLAEVRKEAHCYDHFMSRLAPALTPRNLATLEFGAHTLAGIFFGLAEDFEESAFDVARHAPRTGPGRDLQRRSGNGAMGCRGARNTKEHQTIPAEIVE